MHTYKYKNFTDYMDFFLFPSSKFLRCVDIKRKSFELLTPSRSQHCGTWCIIIIMLCVHAYSMFFPERHEIPSVVGGLTVKLPNRHWTGKRLRSTLV